jgi:branched-chain amino acid transport system ATP-binding protein
MSSNALEAVGLCKNFGALVVAKEIDLALAPGARRALIGPNGAGKTTLVGMLSGVVTPDAGRISIQGVDATREGPVRRVRRGLVRTFQVSSLFPNLSVTENIFLAASARAGASLDLWRPAGMYADLIGRCEEIVRQLKLEDDRDRRVSEIAYGRQRLVEIAVALALEPKILLLDEPAAGIPSGELGILLDAIATLPRDIAILMIEHDMQMVRRFADEVTVLVQGQVLMSGPPGEVMAAPEVQAVYLGSTGKARFAHEAAGA